MVHCGSKYTIKLRINYRAVQPPSNIMVWPVILRALFDIKNKQELYRIQLSESKFSDFALNKAKTQAVYSCESGVLNIIDTATGKVIKVLEGLNVDNVYNSQVP